MGQVKGRLLAYTGAVPVHLLYPQVLNPFSGLSSSFTLRMYTVLVYVCVCDESWLRRRGVVDEKRKRPFHPLLSGWKLFPPFLLKMK